MRPLADNHTLLLSLDPLRESIEIRPRHTIKPGETHPDVAGRRALEALAALDRPDGTLDLGETLGQGGMGVVRVAEQVALGRRVAIKTLRSGVAGERATLSMLREGWLTGSLEHPNVVPVYDLGLDAAGLPLILMRRIEGEHWGALLQSAEGVADRFGVRDLLGWNLGVLTAVCNAMHFAHARGIVHRDLKPENVMIGAFGEVYVLDWGVAISLRDDGTGRMPVASGRLPVAGTPAYMAPEMLRGGPVDARTDVYLLGGILYEILTGRPPHAGASLEALIAATTATPSLPSDAPEELAALCRSALDPDPAGRPPGADAFRRALQEFLEHRGSASLASEAEARLRELRAALRSDAVDHLRVYNLFGEIRFGFRQALRAWPDNRVARARLDEAVATMVRFELERGEPRAAEVLLDELDQVDPALLSAVEAGLRAETARRHELTELIRDGDPHIGRRTRLFVGTVIGVIWTVSPLVGGTMAKVEPTYTTNIGMAATFFVILLGLGVWARESMSATRFNRQILGALLLVPVGQALMAVGAHRLGVPARQVLVLDFALWFQTAALVAITTDRRLGVTAAAFGAAFFHVSAFPDSVFYAMSTCNLIFTLNVLWIWSATSQPASPAR